MYTSRKIIAPPSEVLEIADILAVSRAYNADAGITGGLLNSKRAFAQLLEGPAAAIDALMVRILVDRRHESVQVLRHVAIPRRKLPFWTMAYSGAFGFVEARIAPLVGAGDDIALHQIDELEGLIVEFAKQKGPVPPPIA